MGKPITKEWLKRNLKKFDTEVAERKYLYKVKKLEEAKEGYISSYKLIREQDGEETAIGDIINIPKDYLVKKAEVKVCEEDDKPVEGYKVGDKYLDFTINTKDSEEGTGEDSHLYILFRELVDLRAGEGVVIEEGGIVGVNYASDMRIGTEKDGDDKDKLTLNYETEDLDFSDWDTYETNDPTDPVDPEVKTIEFSCDDKTVTYDEETKSLTKTDETGSSIAVTFSDGEKSATLDITVGTEGDTATLAAFEEDELPKDIGNGWTIDNITGDKSVYDALFA